MILTNKQEAVEIPLGRAEDLTKLTFKNFKPLYRIKSVNTKTYWLCQCNCGNYFTADACYIKSGRTQSCGCIKTESQLNAYKNSKRYIDLTGKQFGKWTVLKELDERYSNGHLLWLCQCECGTIRKIDRTCLVRGTSKSCGCDNHNRKNKPSKNLIGQKFGELIVLEKTTDSTNKGGILWKCRCSCGNICYKTTSGLNKNLINSCGCITMSHGCYLIEKLLKENGIEFIKEYKFQDCKFKNPLPFDYYLPKFNILIEFDGEQHFIDKPHFETLKEIRIKDMIKNNYCFNHNITLIRIPFYHNKNLKIEDLLSNSKFILNKNNIKTYYWWKEDK